MFTLADGTMSDEYKQGDTFKVVNDEGAYNKGTIITLSFDDKSSCPRFYHPEQGSWYTSWNSLSSHKEHEAEITKQPENTMKIEAGNYVQSSCFSDEELGKFVELVKESGISDVSNRECIDRSYEYYGLDEDNDNILTNWDNADSYGRNYKDVTEEFRIFLISLEQKDNSVPISDEEVSNYLTVNERLLALAEGKELEISLDEENWESLEISYDYFGEVLFDPDYFVRIKEEKEKNLLEKSFGEYCYSLALPTDFTSNLFKFFKAGYDAATEDNKGE